MTPKQYARHLRILAAKTVRLAELVGSKRRFEDVLGNATVQRGIESLIAYGDSVDKRLKAAVSEHVARRVDGMISDLKKAENR